MHSDKTDLDGSFRTAEAALGWIRELKLPADPASYQLWYTYAAGTSLLLNLEVDRILTERGGIRQADIQQLSSRLSLSSALSDKCNEISSRMDDQLDRVAGTINTAIEIAEVNEVRLVKAGQKLGGGGGREALDVIIASLVDLARQAERKNAALGENLRGSSQQLKLLNGELAALQAHGLTDPLTLLFNRRHFDECLTGLISAARRTSEPFAVVLTDVDYFKQFNDLHGHLVGDDVLCLIAIEIKRSAGPEAVAARYGGEEFALILPRARLPAALKVAEHLRRNVAARQVRRRTTGEVLGSISISAGVAQWRSTDTVDSLVGRADAALYLAKKRGRNRVIGEAALAACQFE